MVELVSDIFTHITQADFKVLQAIERLMITSEYPLVKDLPKMTSFKLSYIHKRLQILHSFDLIEIGRQENEYYQTALKYRGYDALAFHALVEKDVITSVGRRIGAGKESDIHIVQNPQGEIGILKIHRLGMGTFRSFRKSRDYIASKHHSSRFYDSRLSAQHEVKALTTLYGYIPVPKVWGSNRHCIVMQRINGQELYTYRHLEKHDYQQIFDDILAAVTSAVNMNVIHGDLSPYNIMLAYDEKQEKYIPYFIDWPQCIPKTHPNAADTLILDLNNILSFFGKYLSLTNYDAEKLGHELLIKESE